MVLKTEMKMRWQLLIMLVIKTTNVGLSASTLIFLLLQQFTPLSIIEILEKQPVK